jgi:hypothetical protein
MIRPLRPLLPMAAALLLVGCPTDGAPTDGLPVRLTVEPGDTLSPGDSMRMTARLWNPGRDSVRLEFDSQCQVEFYVMAPDKTVLHPPGGGTTCVSAPSTITLAPKDTLRFTGSWMATSSWLGPHTAYAVLWEHHVPDGSERRYEAGHRSNIVQFEVTPAQ